MLKLVLPASMTREKIRKYFNVFAIVLLSWFAAGIAGDAFATFMIKPSNVTITGGGSSGDRGYRVRNSRRDYDVIVNRNIFDSQNRVAAKPVEDVTPVEEVKKQPTYDGPPVRSDLPLQLLGTVVAAQTPEYSLATISRAGKNESEQYRIGDTVMGEAEVTVIERNRVYFLRNGRTEYIESENVQGSAIAAAPSPRSAPSDNGEGEIKELGPNRFLIDRARVESVMANLSEVMTQARVVPHFENGKTVGWKIFAIKPNSIYKELKLSNGDIIQRINETEIDSPAKALEMYQQLAAESNITMDIIRRGNKMTLGYEIR